MALQNPTLYFSMLDLVLRAFLFYAISATLWFILRAYVVRSSLYNIPGPKSDSWYSGNLYKFYDPDGVPWHLAMVKKFGRAFKFHGLWGDEQVYISDPLALHHVCVKDQDIYEETSMFIAGNRLIFGHGLLGTLGKQHRRQRKMLNPVFSIAHMRGLAPMFYSGAYDLRDALIKSMNNEQSQVIEMKSWIYKTALEYIGLGGFGYSFNSFDESISNEYRGAVKNLMKVLFSLSVVRQYLPWITKIGSPSFRRRLIDIFPSPRLKQMRDIIDVLDRTSHTVYARKREDSRHGVEDYDIMSVLLKANMSSIEADRLDENELLGQLNTFIFAGTDTTGSAISRVLHILSENPDAQARLRQEVVTARENNGGHDLNYDQLVALPYLDAIVRETLRLYSPVSFLSRTTRKDIVLPLSKPITGVNGEIISAIPLKNNTNVVIAIAAANRDPEIWGPDAEQWKPERWLGKDFTVVSAGNGAAKLPGVYSGMMTFMGGSRACIGFKFSQLELKVIISMLLESFEFALPDDKEIIWRNQALLAPFVKGEINSTSKLPLKVSVLQSKVSG